jgi:hypothetical protein
MKQQTVRTTVDIPAGLYRRLKSQAAAQGCSARALILLGIRKTLATEVPSTANRVRFPLIKSDRPKVNLTNEQIYDIIEFP